MNIIRITFLLFSVLCFSPNVLAQSDSGCPALVELALTLVSELCTNTGRNQACYGNIALDAVPRDGIADFTFNQPGDITNITNLEAVNLATFDLDAGVWGIALLKLQANLPDSLPGQNVTFLLFGDVQIENEVAPITTLELTANTGVNVRLRPSADGILAGSLRRGDSVVANGRYTNSAGEDWIRIRYTEHRERTGWVIAWALSGADMDTLEVVQPADPVLGDMQAFRFRSGVDDAACAEAPESGILVQTPGGVGAVNLRANGVDLQFGSTAFLQAVPGDYMYVFVVEDTVSAAAFGVNQFIPAGTVARIPLDENGLASGPPEYPFPYDYARVQALPASTTLPETITVAQPLQEEQVAQAVNEASGLVPRVGTWEHLSPSDAYPSGRAYCDGRPKDTVAGGNTYQIGEASPEAFTIIALNSQPYAQPFRYIAVEPGRYQPPGVTFWSFVVDSPTQMRIVELPHDNWPDCIVDFERWIGE